MKNMKKTILGLAVLLIALVVMMGSVNAASMTKSANEVKKGEEVTVTVKLDNSGEAVHVDLNYDTSKFEFVKADGEDQVNYNESNGTVYTSYASSKAVSEVNFVFKAKDTVTEGANFTATNVKVDGTTEPDATATIAIVEPTTEPTNPTDPTPADPSDTKTPADPSNTDTNKDNSDDTKEGNEVVGKDGKVITRLPQTGAPIFAGIIALVVVAGAVLVARKSK